MDNFKIVTDIMMDLPESYVLENDLGVLHLTYILDGETYGKEKVLDYKKFYDKMRNGYMPTTSQVNPADAKDYFEECIAKGETRILCLAFSSGLSGTYNSMCVAAEEIEEEYPEVKIIVLDSKCASMGEGLFVYKAVEMRKLGKSMEAVSAWLERHIQNIIHVFTVDDLNHLYRGGRVSKTVAVLGGMMSVKPILHVDTEGCLVPIAKARGRKKSLHMLVNYMDEKMGSYKSSNDIVFISHGDAIEDAEYVANEIKKKYGIEKFMINHIGPTIGAHAGPGTIALFFMGEER